MEMNRQEALEFFKEHSRWLSDSWGQSPEGREYKEKFDAAVHALDKLYICEGQWERECGDILRKPQANDWNAPSNYVSAIKLTRAVFQCSLKEGKERVDSLRGRLGL